MSWNSSENATRTLGSIVYHLQQLKEDVLIYMPLVFLALGVIGFIGNVFTFLQPSLRYNSCCIYLLCGSLADLINLLVNQRNLYAHARTSNLLSLITNRHHCKWKLFTLVFLPQASVNFLILSAIDRYACTCSLTSSIRNVRRLAVVPWIIVFTLVGTSVMSIYSPLFYEVQPGLGCTCTNRFVNSISYIVIHGFLTPMVMLSFVLLTYRNVLRSSRRANLKNVDRSRSPFIRMIFTQVFTTSFLTLQWIIFYMYHISAMSRLVGREQKILHYFIWYMSNNIYYLINVKSFYLSTLTSGLFRKTFIDSTSRLFPNCRSQRKSNSTLDKINRTLGSRSNSHAVSSRFNSRASR